MMKLTVAFFNYANALKIVSSPRACTSQKTRNR